MGKRAFDPDRIRVVAFVGHRACGKTSLLDSVLQVAGVTRVAGRVEERTSLLDHAPRERAKGHTLAAGHAWLEWKEQLVSVIDVPGSPALAHERVAALAGADAAVFVVDGPDALAGLGVGAEDILRELRDAGLPTLIVVNKLDRPSDVEAVCAAVQATTSLRALPIHVPMQDHEGQLCGLVSLPAGPAIRFAPDGSGEHSEEPVSDADRAAAALAWERLTEAVALTNDALLEQYLEYLELPASAVWAGLAAATARAELLPVLLASAHLQIGAHALLDAITTLLPPAAAGPHRAAAAGRGFTARVLCTLLDEERAPYSIVRVLSGAAAPNQVWRTAQSAGVRVRKLYQVRGSRRAIATTTCAGAVLAVWEPLEARPGELVWEDGAVRAAPPEGQTRAPEWPPAMVSRVVSAADKKAADALPAALKLLERLDGAVVVGQSALTGQPVLWGHSDPHLALIAETLREDLGLAVQLRPAPVDYREIPVQAVQRAHGVHCRKSADEVQEFGECWVDLAPLDPTEGARFASQVDDMELPKKFHPAIADGVTMGLNHGPTAGYPVTGVEVRCVGGEYDIFMSTDDHFRLAGERAAKNAMEQSGSRLLEPWSRLQLVAPSDQIGDVLGEIGAHRGAVHGVEVENGSAHIAADVPDRELRTFASRLQALTSGRGRFSASHSHYGWLPQALVSEAVAESPFRGRARGTK